MPSDPRRDPLYNSILQTVVGLLMARGTVTPDAVREGLQLDTCLRAVLHDMRIAGAVALPPAHIDRPIRLTVEPIRLIVEPTQLVAIWARLRSAVVIQREAV